MRQHLQSDLPLGGPDDTPEDLKAAGQNLSTRTSKGENDAFNVILSP